MADKIAGFLTNAISVAAFLLAIIIIQKKSSNNPNLRIFGLSVKTIHFILFLGLGISISILLVGLFS